MSHRDGEQIGGNQFPVAHYLVVEVFPMEIVLLLESVFCTRVGKIESLLRRHSHINLHHREDAALEHSLVYISLYLEASLAYINLASLQFDMYHGHSVYQEHHVAASVAQHVVGSLKPWLACYLIAALS